jgi:hypothetical protein
MAREQALETECGAVKCKLLSSSQKDMHRRLTLAPILPLIVITIPMIALPSTRAPIAILQLRPVAIIEDAGQHCQRCYRITSQPSTRLTNLPVGHSPAICHPVGEVGHGPPCSLRRRDRIKVGIGSSRRPSESAGLLVNRKREVEATLRSTVRLADLIRLGRRGPWTGLLIVRHFASLCHGAWVCNRAETKIACASSEKQTICVFQARPSYSLTSRYRKSKSMPKTGQRHPLQGCTVPSSLLGDRPVICRCFIAGDAG